MESARCPRQHLLFSRLLFLYKAEGETRGRGAPLLISVCDCDVARMGTGGVGGVEAAWDSATDMEPDDLPLFLGFDFPVGFKMNTLVLTSRSFICMRQQLLRARHFAANHIKSKYTVR